jgi:hemoglobin/transferrin/lactoferrin receptor protein
VRNVIILILVSSVCSFAQVDSSYLDYDLLTWADINEAVKREIQTKIISGSRVEQNLQDVSSTVFVISKEEIRDNGYVTLTDALKSLPGIRVSQPGSALEGETFLMRGLIGNQYAKILINDVPVKPFVVNGMPIGYQLPIAQAERIEIIYGPAATLYGADASAGIINIILKDSEYPTHAQANVEFGENGFTRVNVQYGGKLNVGNDVMKLMIYGGFTSFNDRKIKYDLDSLYNPDVYERFYGYDDPGDINYELRPNYLGSVGSPTIRNLPHNSNILGTDLRYKGMHLSLQRFFRRDHSALGLSPYAISYAIPINSFGETISNGSISYAQEYKKWSYQVRFSILDYNTETISSNSYIITGFGAILNTLIPDQLTGSTLDSVRTAIDNLYFTGIRFAASQSREYFSEAIFNFNISKALNLTAGINYQNGNGTPIENYLMNPFSTDLTSVDSNRFDIEEVSYTEVSSFAELSLNLEKIRLTLGGQLLNRSDDYLSDNDAILNPRIGLLYKVNPSLSFRSSFSKAFRYPSPFYTASTFTIKTESISQITTGSPNLTPENTLNYELGIRYIKPKLKLDASLYYLKTTDFLNYSLDVESQLDFISIGYFNEEDSYADLLGIQGRLQFYDVIPDSGLDAMFNFNYSVGEERIRGVSLTEAAELITLPDVRSQPNWMGQVRLKIDLFSDLTLTVDQTFMTNSFNRNTFRLPSDLLGVDSSNSSLYNKGYYIVDARLLFRINNKLNTLLRVDNVFNAKYAGIDATSDPDALIYNPQPLRMVRFGVNFNLNE